MDVVDVLGGSDKTPYKIVKYFPVASLDYAAGKQKLS